MITYILIALAAMFNAIMDTLWTHFSTSIFKGLKVEWWNPNYSWMSVKNFLGIVRLDAWHLAKYGMLFSIVSACVFYQPVLGLYDLLILPLIWSITFELFYSYIFKKQ
jgi:hypothetical protein